MDSEPNATYYITIAGFIDIERYRALYFVLMLTAYVFVICSNGTIVCLICFYKKLHEPMYYFVAALLCNSIIYSTTIYPKLMSEILSERQLITYTECLSQYFWFYALIGAEFLLLTAMAYDRFVAICEPLRYTAIMKKSRVGLLIGFAWVVPACEVSVPAIINRDKKLCQFVFEGIICNSTVYALHCSKPGFLNIYGLLVMANICFIPVIFKCFTYARIFVIASGRGPEVRRKALQTCLPHLLVLINFTCSSAYDVLLFRIQAVFPKVVRLIMTLQVVLYHPIINPIIYGLKMKEISNHLKRLLCFR